MEKTKATFVYAILLDVWFAIIASIILLLGILATLSAVRLPVTIIVPTFQAVIVL